MTDIRQREWKLIRELRASRPRVDAVNYEAWCERREELLTIDLIESLQHSLLVQFPEKKYEQDRENIAQDVLLKFLEDGIYRYDPNKASQAGLRAYLGKMAHRKMKKLLSRSSRSTDQADLLEWTVEDPRGDQDHRMMVLEEWFRWLFDHLKPEEREIARLRFEEGLTLAEVSSCVGKPVSSVGDICKRICGMAVAFEKGDMKDG